MKHTSIGFSPGGEPERADALILDTGLGILALNGRQLHGVESLDLHIDGMGGYANLRLRLDWRGTPDEPGSYHDNEGSDFDV